jgi:protease-4
VAPGDDYADARAIIDRRRLRRRLTFWRLAAIAVAVFAAAIFFWRDLAGAPYVARFAVVGPIFDDFDRDRTLRRLARDDDVVAVVVRIDSPGGTVAGSEALYDSLRTVAKAKPVVAVMGEAAASGGYVAALAAERIFARGATLTGSIGVVAEFPNVEGLLREIGVQVNRVASAPLKAEPSPFRAPSDAVLAAQEALIADSYDWFVGLVAERRGLSPERARELGDGRVYTGRQAQENGLIDAIGGEPEARAWLAEARDVPERLPTRRIDVEREDDGVAGMLGGVSLRGLAESLTAGQLRLMAILR